MPSKAQSSSWGSPFNHQARCFMRPFSKVLRSSNNKNFLNFFYNFVMTIAKTQPRICALIRNETSLNYSPLPKVLGPFSAYGWGGGGGARDTRHTIHMLHALHVEAQPSPYPPTPYILSSNLCSWSPPQSYIVPCQHAHPSSNILHYIFIVPFLSVLTPFLYTVPTYRAHPCTPQRQSSTHGWRKRKG